MDRIPKPAELLAARPACVELFETLQRWFDVPETLPLSLADIDSGNRELVDVQYVMGLAMRKLQAFHLLTSSRVATTSDVVLTIAQDLERALQQAPRARLRREAAKTDWDAELAALDGLATADDDVPATTGPLDEEDETGSVELLDAESRSFREAHKLIRAAAQAVLRASDGRIKRLE
ncbi:hypothetical protein [Euzebya tangerina]|uniref:hypothetical protein n=1 Tax=Euzebya tangerina TaxID=591198 RepID=UPI000E320626|nr:hypothetical protein [Euzebya tangerina]